VFCDTYDITALQATQKEHLIATCDLYESVLMECVHVPVDDVLHGSGSSVSSVVSQTSGTVSSSVVSSRSGIADHADVSTFRSLTRLQELCESTTDIFICIITVAVLEVLLIAVTFFHA